MASDVDQRERPVDDGRDLAGLEEFVQLLQVVLAFRALTASLL
jgi:hypothetical protein